MPGPSDEKKAQASMRDQSGKRKEIIQHHERCIGTAMQVKKDA